MSALNPRDFAIKLGRARQVGGSDRISTFEFNSVVQRRFAEYACSGIESYIRAANKFGKTFIGAVLGVAFAQCKKRIGIGEWGTVELPNLPCPNVGVLLMQSFGQSIESAVGAVRRAIGDWPHDEAKIAGGLDYVGIIYIATQRCSHGTGENCPTCSRIYCISSKGQIPSGFQVDWVWADEPPSEPHWRELRFRSRANAEFYSWITATPLEARFYRWLRDDFEGCFGSPKNGKVELKARLEDNRFLTPTYIAKQKERAKTDPYYEARINGEYCDVSGTCPLDYKGLQRWLDRSESPRLAVIVEQVRDGEPMYALRAHARGPIQVHWDPEPEEFYIVCSDPSSGVKDPDKSLRNQPRNPAAINVVSMRQPRHVLRFNGYVSAVELGLMSRVICEAYNNALWVPEMNGGWGEVMMQGFGFDYSNVYSDIRVSDRKARASEKVGWYQTHSRRGLLIGALQRAVDQDGIDVRNRELVHNLMDLQIDDNDRWDQGQGRGPHAEDAITLGVPAYLLEILPVPGPALPALDETPREALMREIAAKHDRAPGEGGANYGGRWK